MSVILNGVCRACRPSICASTRGYRAPKLVDGYGAYMPDSSNRRDSDDGFVYGVNPEAPRFDELLRRPEIGGNDSLFAPAGPFRRWLGARRAVLIFRAGLLAVGGLVVAIALM